MVEIHGPCLQGGGDVTGGVNIPTQLPANWIHRSQKHIVVTTNYRVNIFAYPNARGLNGSTNFALQDQRQAIEWVAENIAAFGGDPAQITLWGQSAGAGATDMYLFSQYEDPIIRASVSSSGVALGRSNNVDYAGTNFSFVAKSLGCGFEDAALELQCMRRVPMPRIENFVGQYQDNSSALLAAAAGNPSQPAISFTRQVDNQWVLANYTDRYLRGQVARLPKMIGTTAREASALVAYPLHNYTAGPSEQAVYDATLSTVCAAHDTSVLREQAGGLPTYRYEWAGNFTSLGGGVPWLGAYHYSDLYMLFGTYLINPLPGSGLEARVSERMQDYLLDFVADPTSLPASGWPAYEASGVEGGGTIARFGADGQVVRFVDGDSVEGACHIAGVVYDTRP